MSGFKWDEIDVGDGMWVGFPNTVRDSFSGMVTEVNGDRLVIKSTAVLPDGSGPVDDVAFVSRTSLDLPQLRVGRHILRLEPWRRRWSDVPNAPMCFGTDKFVVPTGTTLDELARYEDSLFILDSMAASYQRAARFQRPFYDHKKQRVFRQHVTVFRLDDSAKLERRKPSGPTNNYRHVLPANTTFSRVDEGYVRDGGGGALSLGVGLSESALYRLYEDTYFAIETTVLQQALSAS